MLDRMSKLLFFEQQSMDIYCKAQEALQKYHNIMTIYYIISKL